MNILLGIIVIAVVVACIALTLWVLPNDGHGQRVFGTDDWPHGADRTPRHN